MEKEEIFKRTEGLPEIEIGSIAEDNQIWEGNEDGAHFKVTRETMPSRFGKLPPVYALSVSGDESGKARLISDFEKALGKPTMRSTYPNLPGVEFVLWKAENADKQRAK